MAQEFAVRTPRGEVRERLNQNARELNAIRAPWSSGNTRAHVSAVIAGKIRALDLRDGGDPGINPNGIGGSNHWEMPKEDVKEFDTDTAAFLAIGTTVLYNDRLYRLLVKYNGVPIIGGTATWLDVFSNQAGGDSGGATPDISPTSYGPTTFAGLTSNVGAGRPVTVTFLNSSGSVTGTAQASTNAQGGFSLTTSSRTGQFRLSVTTANGVAATSGPHDIAVATGGGVTTDGLGSASTGTGANTHASNGYTQNLLVPTFGASTKASPGQPGNALDIYINRPDTPNTNEWLIIIDGVVAVEETGGYKRVTESSPGVALTPNTTYDVQLRGINRTTSRRSPDTAVTQIRTSDVNGQGGGIV